jgi:hypothetical protein
VSGRDSQYVDINSPSAGVCHVELTFGTGFTYSADVTFTSEPGLTGPSCPWSCPMTTYPKLGAFAVNNPSTTCVDGGSDAEASAVPADAPSQIALDAGLDAEGGG